MSKARLRILTRGYDVSMWDLFDAQDFTTVKAELDKLEANVQYSLGETANFRVEPYGYDGGIEVRLDIYRDETDAEYDERLRKEEAKKEKARLARERQKEKARQVLMESEEAERAEYERLRAKFEDA